MERLTVSQKRMVEVKEFLDSEENYEIVIRERFCGFMKSADRAINAHKRNVIVLVGLIYQGEKLLSDINRYIDRLLGQSLSLDEIDEFLYNEVEEFRLDVKSKIHSLRVHLEILVL